MAKTKRAATSQLTHDNWDDEDPAEEAGEFKRASQEQIQGRKMAKAKRRGATESVPSNTVSNFLFLSVLLAPE